MSDSLSIARASVRDLSSRRFDLWHYARSSPLLIEDAASDWRAFATWNARYLAQVLGERQVVVKYNASGIFDFNEGAASGVVEDRELSAESALALMEGSDGFKYYLLNRDIRSRFPELIRDIETPHVLDATKELVAVNLWVGGRGTKSPLHYDSMDNLLVQVTGRKRIMLFRPEEQENLYPARQGRYPHMSRMNVFECEGGRYPRFAQARRRATEFTLMPGSAIYLPPFWWHAVESLDLSTSVNFWWRRSTFGAWLKQLCFPSRAQMLAAVSGAQG